MSSAERIRRMQARRARGIRLVAPVEVSAGVLEALVRKHLLPPDRATDRTAVGTAIANLLARWERTVIEARPRMLDTSRPIWMVSDIPGARFAQDGRYFDENGWEVPAMRASAPEV